MLGRISAYRQLFGLKSHLLKLDQAHRFVLKGAPSRSLLLRAVSSLGWFSGRTIIISCLSASAAYIHFDLVETEDEGDEDGYYSESPHVDYQSLIHRKREAIQLQRAYPAIHFVF
jgi:hypothetical protein